MEIGTVHENSRETKSLTRFNHGYQEIVLQATKSGSLQKSRVVVYGSILRHGLPAFGNFIVT